MKYRSNFNFKRFSLSKEYLIFASIIMLVIIIVLFWIIVSNYSSFKAKRKELYQTEAGIIVSALSDSFEYINNFSKFLADKIVQGEKSDPDTIASLLELYTERGKLKDDTLTWASFDFVDPEGLVIAAMVKGVIQNPIKIDRSKREWMETARLRPFTLFLSNPDLSVTSGEFIIPVGYGITDQNNKFLGILSSGFNINKLKNKIYKYLRSDYTDFIILNQHYKTVLYTQEKLNKNDLKPLVEYIKSNDKKTADSEILPQSFTIGDSEYYTYSILQPYNYIVAVGESSILIKEEFKQIILPQIIKTLLLGAFFITVLYFFGKKIVTPMSLLSEKAILISKGNFDVNIPRLNSIEANNLAQALLLVKKAFKKEQATRLKLAQTKRKLEDIIKKLSYTKSLLKNTKDSNESLEQKVLERTAELEASLAVKTEFLNNMSHEIRTPLQGFTVISEGLVEHWTEFEDQKKLALASQVANNAKRLASLLGNLLDLSKFSAGKMLLDLRKIDLNIILDEMLEECKTLYLNNKNIVIEAVKSRSGRIIADPERIKQVLRNLFTNAIKFSPPNGKIYVTLSEHEITYEDGIVVEALQFSITDQGIGVPNSELEIVFSPFIQSSKTKTQAGGTGLGLAIAKEIIIAHAGQIWANNDTNGNTVFNFLIPTNLSNQAEQYKVIVKSKAKQKVIPHHEVTILIIDDEEACLTSMDLLLHGSVFKLEKANCGYAGLNYLRANPYSIDIVLLDLMMPDIYGLKVLAEIKSDHALSNLPIVIQSGTSNDTEIERAYRLGIVGYIKKPYQKQVVMDMLYSIMQVDVLPPILQ